MIEGVREYGGDESGFTLPLRGSLVGEEELAAVADVVRSGGPLSMGGWRERFEQAVRSHLGVPYGLSVTSGTTALRLAIQLLDLEPGDEVIATAQTYQATIQPLLDHGAVVRFCDVDPDTLNVDPDTVVPLITDRTRAIIAVHYGGAAADVPRLMSIAARHGITVIEDAAHALGGSLHGRPLGAAAHFSCFSFHASKNVTTLGEGGFLTLPDRATRDRAEMIRDNRVDAVATVHPHRFAGRDRPAVGALYPELAYSHDYGRVRASGINGTLSEAAAAVGLVQLRRLPQFSARRRAIAAHYEDVLADLPGVRIAPPVPGATHAFHFFTFFVDPGVVDRDAVLLGVAADGVSLQQRYFPLHLMPEWRSRGHAEGECPVTERLWFTEQVNLPCQPGLRDSDVEHIAGLVRRQILAAGGVTALPAVARPAIGIGIGGT
jgi:perosamine synthetase